MTADRSKEEIQAKGHFALIAGCCASAASFFGKLSGRVDGESELNIFIIRAVCIGLMILSNAMVWTFFVKALHSNGGTLRATVMSAATNYFISYMLGFLIFQESISLLKGIGIVFIFLGLVVIAKDESSNESSNDSTGNNDNFSKKIK